MKESQRLLPASCILFFRAAQSPFALGNHELPAGTRLLTSPFLAHRDPALYERPLHFLPERWERSDPSFYEYMPFGAGPRVCIGMSFALMEATAILATLAQHVRFETATDAEPVPVARVTLTHAIRSDPSSAARSRGSRSGPPRRTAADRLRSAPRHRPTVK